MRSDDAARAVRVVFLEEGLEEGAGEDDRVAAPAGVDGPDDPPRVARGGLEERPNRRRADGRKIDEGDEGTGRLRGERPEARPERGVHALRPIGVQDGADAGEVEGPPHLVGAGAEDDDDVADARRAERPDDGLEKGRSAEGEERLRRPAHPARLARREDDSGGGHGVEMVPGGAPKAYDSGSMPLRPLPNLAAFDRPGGLEEALDLLADPSARVHGGGTALALSRHPGVRRLVDLGRLGLDRIEAEAGGLRLGAMVTIGRLAEAEELGAVAGGIVRAAARTYRTQAHRNAATLGGVLLADFPLCDLAAALLAAGGTVRVATRNAAGGDGAAGGVARRDIDLDAFFHPSPTGAVGRGIVESVFLPGGGAGGYERITKTETDASTAAAAVRLDADPAPGGRIRSIRIALTGVSQPPARAAAAEAAAAGSPLAEAAARAAAAAVEGLEPIGDLRATAEYRRAVLPVLVRRAVEAAAGAVPGASR